MFIYLPDYIRTFTWDKKLETILKSNFGGQGRSTQYCKNSLCSAEDPGFRKRWSTCRKVGFVCLSSHKVLENLHGREIIWVQTFFFFFFFLNL